MPKFLKINYAHTADHVYPIRKETLLNIEYIVAPVTMMAEGVHVGANTGSVYHDPKYFSQNVESWNGQPVTLDHPTHGGNFISANVIEAASSVVGKLYNTQYNEDTKTLVSEAWLESSRLDAMDPDLAANIMAGKVVDVSIGAYVDELEETGEWNGESYDVIAEAYRPDHLALLFSDGGACSVADGCGLGVFKAGGVEMEHMLLSKQRDGKEQRYGITVNVDYKELVDSARTLVYSMDTMTEFYYLEAVEENYIVYQKQSSEGTQYYRRAYETDDSGIDFSGQAEEVKKSISFETLSEGGTKDMKCPKITRIIDANIGFTEDDREMMDKWDDKKLSTLLAHVQASKTEAKETEAPKEEKEVQANTAVTKENIVQLLNEATGGKGLLELLSPGDRELITEGMAVAKDQKTKLAAYISENQDVYSKEEVEKMGLDELKKTYRLVNRNGSADSVDNGSAFLALGDLSGSGSDTVSAMSEDPKILPLGADYDKYKKDTGTDK